MALSVARIADNLATGGCVKPSVVVDKCDNLKDGKQYYLKGADGKYAVVDKTTEFGFMKQISSDGASKFTAKKIGCNLYGLCVNGFCMSRCSICKSTTGDKQTTNFHFTNSNRAYSQWKFISTGKSGEFNLKIDSKFGYLTSKKTPSGDYQLSLSTQLTVGAKFQFIEVK